MRMTRTGLIIMAKAPEPGLAKTRLIPALGADGAAAVAQQLLTHTIQTARATSRFSYQELCVTPNGQHPSFTNLAPDPALTDQGGGDLGARMQRAFERVLGQCDAAIMIGTDAPAMAAELLDQAVDDLLNQDAVFVPAFDGGYTLIGLKKVIPTLFIDMPWSTDRVMAITRDRLRREGAHWHEYLPMADVDEPPDLVHLPSGWLP